MAQTDLSVSFSPFSAYIQRDSFQLERKAPKPVTFLEKNPFYYKREKTR